MAKRGEKSYSVQTCRHRPYSLDFNYTITSPTRTYFGLLTYRSKPQIPRINQNSFVKPDGECLTSEVVAYCVVLKPAACDKLKGTLA